MATLFEGLQGAVHDPWNSILKTVKDAHVVLDTAAHKALTWSIGVRYVLVQAGWVVSVYAVCVVYMNTLVL